MKPERPTKIKVGPVRLRVDYDSQSVARVCRETGESSVYGAVEHRHQRMVIDPDQGSDEMADSILHETLHAVCKTAGIGQGEQLSDEQFILRVSKVLLLVLRDNPDLVAYLASTDDDG